MTLLSDLIGANPFDLPAKRCPVCGKPGKPVKAETLQSIIKNEYLPVNLNGYCLCLSHACDVIYFGEQVIYKDGVNVQVWFKEDNPSVPVCYCRNVTEADIIEHIANLECCEDIQDIQNHTGANTGTACLTKNPAGI